MGRRHLLHAVAVAAVTVSLAVVVPSGVAGAAGTLPAGFLLTDVPTGLQGDPLTDFAFLPDESMIAIGKNGRVNWVPKTGAPARIATLPVTASGDMGLLGLAIAPDYATSRTLYTTVTVPSTAAGSGRYGVLRLSRWTVTVDGAGNPTGLTGERTIVETSADTSVHGMSTVIADEDGTLWVSVGDSASFTSVDPLALRSLDPGSLHGKLLHIRPDGTGVPTNPFYEPANPNSVRSKVYASGFRSPFRFSLDPDTKQPILGDVGYNTFEEIDLLNPGNSYGWPCWEANQRAPGYRDLPGCAGVDGVAPLWSYPRSDGSSVTGGVIYQGKNYPAEYQGRYFFGDYTGRRLWTTRFDSSGTITTPVGPAFGNDIGSVVKIGSAPVSGDIVYADIATGNVRRLVYAPGNNPPAAMITATNEPATRKLTFSAGQSSDPNGDALTYAWEFGDGTTATGSVVEHTYAADPPSFTARLTAMDTLGATGSSSLTVYPSNHTPVLSLQQPDPSRTFAVGDVVQASATATDQEDGALQVSWSTEIVHCRGAENCHRHPGIQQAATGAFNLRFDGHPGDTRLEISAIATDSKGATVSRTFVVKPKQRRITVQSNTPAEFTIGDETVTSGLFTVGTDLTVIAPEAAADMVSTFAGWADGAQRVRPLTVPDADVTLRVDYATPIDRRYNGEAALRQVLGAPAGVEQGDATVRWRVYAGGRLYWSPQTGVHPVTGEILKKYLAAGGHQSYGIPSTDELSPSDGRGRYTLFGTNRSIYWSPQTGAKLVFGAIHEKWSTKGGVAFSGYPTTDEVPTPDAVGRFNDFERGHVYWHPAVGAFEVHGAIYDRWGSLGWERAVVGYPATDETPTPDGAGRYNHFQSGSVYWSPGTGAWEVHGSIRQKWAALGWERSPLGYPATNENATPDGVGRYNHFQSGSIYWSPYTGAYAVYGLIRNRWAALGWERSYLGYPTSDEFEIPGGRRTNFQFGYITFTRATAAVADRRY